MRQSTVAIALIGVFFLVIGGWQLFGPIRTAQADSPTVTPTAAGGTIPLPPTLTPTSTATNSQGTIPIPPSATSTATSSVAGTISTSIYLPLVAFPPSPTPTPTSTDTPTITPTSTATPCNGSVQAIQNPSFEDGLNGWAITGYPGASSAEASDGTLSVELGGYDYAYDALSQTITVPSWANTAAIYASWWMLTTDDVTNGYDDLEISVVDQSSNPVTPHYQVWNTATQKVWTTVRQDISNVAQNRGSTLTVKVAGRNDSTQPTIWYVDNVRVVFACGSTTASVVTPSPTPTPR